MYKFYWSNLQRKTGPKGEESPESSMGGVSGSQRVLLKLRKMQSPSPGSGSRGRPKSFDPRDLFPSEPNNNNTTEEEEEDEDAECKPCYATSEALLRPSRVPLSHSHHHFFYNKTWNEAILHKTAKDWPDPEMEDDDEDEEDPFIIRELQRSPTKKYRDSDSDFEASPVTGRRRTSRNSVPGVPPRAEKEERPPRQSPPSKSNKKSAILYRSKSCERPKKKETFRLPDPLSRFSSNFAGRWKGSRTGGNASRQRRTAVDVQNHRNLQSEVPSSEDNELSRVIGDDRTSLVTQNSNSSAEEDISRARSLQGSSINSNSSSSLADRMRGLRHDVQKRLSRFRSRSAERITNKSKRSSRSPPNRRMTTSSIPAPEDYLSLKHQHSRGRESSSVSSKPPVPPPPITYNGPFIGTARALVDCTPSPYDIDALRFKRGDRVDIISMNPNGLWKGKCEGRIGNFKFINVEVLRPERKSFYVVPKSQSISNLNHSHKKVRHDSREYEQDSEEDEEDTVDGGDEDVLVTSSHNETMSRSDYELPKTVEGLLKSIGLEEHISVFILNGYEDVDNFMEMDHTELDYLGINNENHRKKIMSAVDLLLSRSETPSNSGGDSDVTLESSSPPPPNVGGTTMSIPRDSGVFNEPDSDESWSISSSYSTTPFKQQCSSSSLGKGVHTGDEISLGIASLDLNPPYNAKTVGVKSSLTTSRTLNFHLMSTNGESSYQNEEDTSVSHR